MSDRDSSPRRPQAFRVPGAEAGKERATASEREAPTQRAPRAIGDIAGLRLEPVEAVDEDVLSETELPARPRHRSFSFGKLALGALGALVSLGIGLWIESLVRDLFARNDWLGWAALGAAIVLILAVLGIVLREILGLMRLSAVERERQEVSAAYASNSRADAEVAIGKLGALLADRPDTTAGRAKMKALKDEVIDGADLIALAERDILGPLDRQALSLILATSKRTSVVTAVSPRAIVDVSYVLFESVKLIRRMSELYGARPGAIGMIRLTRDVVGHLAVTGSIAIGDDLIGQVIGHGLAAKLSARLGEGVVNGLLTARIGLAAMDLCRPFPFLRAERPKLRAILSELTRFASRQQSSQNKTG